MATLACARYMLYKVHRQGSQYAVSLKTTAPTRTHSFCCNRFGKARLWQFLFAMQMVTDLLLESGDSILCESFTYFYLTDSVLPIKGYNAMPMKMDDQGICPNSLRQVILSLLAHLCPLWFFFWLDLQFGCSVRPGRLCAKWMCSAKS